MRLNNFDRLGKVYDLFMHSWFLYREKQLHTLLLPLDGNERVADLGGGTGHYARYFAKFCREVCLLDESPGMLKRVGQHPKIKTYCGNVLTTPFAEDYFDVILLCDVLHHLGDQNHLLNECHRILKPGGRLCVYDFNREHPVSRILGWLERNLFGPLHYRTPGEINKKITKTGFSLKVLKKKYYYYILIAEKA